MRPIRLNPFPLLRFNEVATEVFSADDDVAVVHVLLKLDETTVLTLLQVDGLCQDSIRLVGCGIGAYIEDMREALHVFIGKVVGELDTVPCRLDLSILEEGARSGVVCREGDGRLFRSLALLVDIRDVSGYVGACLVEAFDVERVAEIRALDNALLALSAGVADSDGLDVEVGGELVAHHGATGARRKGDTGGVGCDAEGLDVVAAAGGKSQA